MASIHALNDVFRSSAVALSLQALSCAADDERDLGNPVKDNPCSIPVDDVDALVAWLGAESYANWPAESSIHDSDGPHFGNVRTWISEELNTSLREGHDTHPLCAATVKELYGDAEALRGVSVSVKVRNQGTSGDWFWFEIYREEVFAGGTDVDTCVACHERGNDYVLSRYPLR